MATYSLTLAQLALGYFDKTTISPDGKITAGYNNSMGDLLHEFTLNYLDSEQELDRIGGKVLTRTNVTKTPDGQTGWAATMTGNGRLSMDYILPETFTIVMTFKTSTVANLGLIFSTDQMKVWIDNTGKINIWFKDSSDTTRTYVGSTSVQYNNWNNLTVSLTPTVVRVILNGTITIEQTGSWGLKQPSSATLYFGYDGTNYFTGQFDRIKIYNRAFSVTDAVSERDKNCLPGDYPSECYYTTPWLKMQSNEYLVNYTVSSSVPTGKSLWGG